jgi:PAS domain S-box-containing protein
MEPQQIKHSELTFQLIVESAPNAIILVNKEGKIAYVNAQTEKLFGYVKSELIGQLVELLIPPRYHHHHAHFRNSFFSAPTERAMGAGRELFAIRKDGKEFPIEIGLNPLITVEGTLVLASIIDITERKKAEERFRLVVESAPNAMVLVNVQGDISLVNEQAEKLFGYHRSELFGKKIEILIPERFRKHHPDFRNMFFSKPQTRSMGAGRDLFAVRKDEKEIPVEIGLNPIETTEGNMVLASIIDITERKEQEIIIKKQVQLESKNKELEQFAYIASHDLQEPLRTVSNFAIALEEDYGTQLDDNAKRYLSSIHRATKRMSALIRALLDFSLLGRYRNLTYVDLKKIIGDTISDLESVIHSTGTMIRFGEMPSLLVYETEMRQLFQNMILNAIKFRKKEIPPEIYIGAQKLNDKWKISLHDNGIGIDPIHYERIFQIFQRLHNENEYDGYGIGLANCKKIVELHEGEIWVESMSGKGTTFHFTISNLKL